jgi:hypothetical protein
MDISSILLILNIIISVIHPIKHIPQIVHTMKTKKVDDLSKANIICEFVLNILSLTSSILVYFYIGKQPFFLPIVIEKASSTIFITVIYTLKKKYTRVYIYEEIIPINNNPITHGSFGDYPLIDI